MKKTANPFTASKAQKPRHPMILADRISPLFGPEEEDDDSDDEEDDEEDDDANAGKKKKKSGKTYTQADVDALLTKARGEEKTKLHEKLTAAETRATTAEATITAKDTEIATLNSKITALTESIKDGEFDGETFLEKYGKELEQKVSKTSDKRIEKMQQELEELRSENQAAKVRELRAKLIRKNGGSQTMVVELVTGDTKEEILESIKRAQKAFDRIAKKGKKRKAVANEDDDEDEIDEEDEEDDEEEPSDESDDEDADEDEDEDDDADDTGTDKTKRRKAPPELPASKGKGGRGAGGGSSKERALLTAVKGMSPAEYRAKRNEILGAVNGAARRQGASPFKKR